ncbi:hypothetical protein DWUX_42 [Desulfovibrio diazotrophicus]|nr:hypothetical protein DWUX_42 [Desulfovibrio diazotrophicus]
MIAHACSLLLQISFPDSVEVWAQRAPHPVAVARRGGTACAGRRPTDPALPPLRRNKIFWRGGKRLSRRMPLQRAHALPPRGLWPILRLPRGRTPRGTTYGTTALRRG